MQIVVNSQILATELRLLNKITPQKPAIAILGHVRISADDGLHLYATDMEVGLSTSCPARVERPGVLALPAARLLALVEQFPDADVSIGVDKGQASVTCGAFRSRLQSLPANDFPASPEVSGTSYQLDAEAFRQLIARTRYAVNAASSKYILKGALLTMTGDGAAMVATDSRRLALATMARTGPDGSMVVPVKALDMLAGGGEQGMLEVTVGDKHIAFALNGRLLASRTIDGKFPAYERIVPQDNDLTVTVDRLALTSALRRIVLVSEDNRATYFAASAGQLELTTQSAEVGAAAEVVKALYDGTPLKVCVNAGFVLDFLNAASSSTVTLKLKDAKSPMLLMDGDDHVGVIMLLKG